ncbi:MAG: hypothetical protein JXL67_04445, partial [Calditrichaeota bacterium]|nr:hypothetical protein [Calditrichota bacterium]
MNPEKKIFHLLGIESSGITSGLYISDNDRLLAQMTLNIQNIHSRRLSTMLTSLLEQSDMKIRDIDGIILSAG